MSDYYFEERRQFNSGFGEITYGVQLLMFATIVAFCVQLLVDVPLGIRAGMPPGGIVTEWLAFSPAFLGRMQVWGFVTYIFLHQGLSHLFINMLTLFIAGPEVERTLGTRQFFRFYFVCGIAGALATFVPALAFGHQMAFVLGASGATLGTLVAFATIDPDRQFFLFPLPIPITARGVVLIILAFNLAMAVLGGFAAVAPHLGGMAAGYAYMKLRPRFAYWQLQRRIRQREKPSKKNAVPVEEEEKLAEAIDNIFKFQDRDRK